MIYTTDEGKRGAVVKHVRYRGNNLVLVSSNPAYPPVILAPSCNPVIEGVVIGSVHGTLVQESDACYKPLARISEAGLMISAAATLKGGGPVRDIEVTAYLSYDGEMAPVYVHSVRATDDHLGAVKLTFRTDGLLTGVSTTLTEAEGTERAWEWDGDPGTQTSGTPPG